MRKFVLGMLGGAALACGSTAANATVFMGATAGCFGAACAPNPATATTGGLTWNTGSFNQSDSNGFLAIGSGAENLGTFTLDGTPLSYNSLFTLLVNFSLPVGTNPPGGVYSALITGSVTNSNTGGVFVDFNNTPQLFTFPGGAFTLMVNDLGVNSGGVATQITGVIRVVPEPATWAMMLLGFGAIGMAMRRRRQPAFAQIA